MLGSAKRSSTLFRAVVGMRWLGQKLSELPPRSPRDLGTASILDAKSQHSAINLGHPKYLQNEVLGFQNPALSVVY